MKAVNLDRIGSKVALYIGFPLGVFFSLIVLFLSLFPILDFGLVFIGGELFWNPIIWAGVIPVTFIFLLWTAGGRIKVHLDRKDSIVWTSFLFTLFVNTWLFGLILLIFVIGGFFYSPIHTSNIITVSLISLGVTLLTYIISTVMTSMTIGLLIVTITRNKIYR